MKTAFIGALSLDGEVVKAEGMLPALVSAKELGIKKLYFPHDPAVPFLMLKGLECIVVQHLEGQESPLLHSKLTPENPKSTFSLTATKGFLLRDWS
ncbi:hypothetical protein [Neobacillus mesonae]|uniref:hypothetical protein n=1 Tax=Neobacillus mesonae TaxID=1193713 RepID=UPI002E228EC0|nr:hypothetical protein [Neobacillus mesonae]